MDVKFKVESQQLQHSGDDTVCDQWLHDIIKSKRLVQDETAAVLGIVA